MKRLVMGVVLGVVLIVGIVLFVATRGAEQSQITQQYMVPPGLTTAISSGNGSAIFSNGRALTSYNVRTGNATQLSPDLVPSNLASINSLSASSNQRYYVFREAAPTQDSLLSDQLAATGLDPAGSYWWSYNSVSKTFKLLPSTVVLAKFSGNTLYTLSSASASETLAAYDPNSLQVASSINVPNISNFFVLPNGYLLETPSSSVIFTKDGVVNRTLQQSFTVVGVSSDGQTAVGVQSQNGTQSLATLAVVKGSISVIDSDIAGAPVWAQNGTVLYTKSQTITSQPAIAFYTYNTVNHKRFAWDTSSLKNTTLTPLALVDQSSAIVADPSNNTYLIGSSLAPIKIPPTSYRRSLPVDSLSVTIQSSNTGTLLAPLDTTDSGEEQSIIYTQLKKDGFNPQLLTIVFPSFDREDDD